MACLHSRSTRLRLEALEGRDAPATLVGATKVTYQDTDGDTVTVAFSKPVLNAGNVGTIFTGEGASVVFGDYLSGANHVLPTGGSARRYSGLSTDDFVRWTTWQRIDRDAASAMARDTGAFADAEGLPAHAAAARQWAIA